MPLPNVAVGEPHVAAHNAERQVLTGIEEVTNETFVSNLQGKLGLGISVLSTANGVVDDRAAIVTADASASTLGGALLFRPGTHRVSSNLVINNPVELQPGAVIKPDNGVTVTLSAGVLSVQKQIFDQSSGGVVIPKRVDAWHPAWWGPVNTENDTATWVAMMAARTASGERHTIRLPQGISRIWGIDLERVTIEGQGHSSIVYPALASAVPGGYMVQLGVLGTIQGGEWGSDTAEGIEIIRYSGIRAWVRDAYIRANGANTIGVRALGGGGSITPRLYNLFIYGNDAVGSIGVKLESADSELTNVMVTHTDVGIRDGSGTIATGIHIWECTTGLVPADGSRYLGVYIENNLGWGVDASGADDIHLTGHFWRNGKGVSDTGGIKVAGVGVSCQNARLDLTLDDNVGVGLLIDDADRAKADVHVASKNVKEGSGAARSTHGVKITATSTDTDITIKGRDAHVLTSLLLNESVSTRVDLGRRRSINSAPTTFGPNSTSYSSISTPIDVGANQTWLVKGWLVVEGPQSSDAKIRITGPTGSTGWLGVAPAVSGGTASTSASSVNPASAASLTNGVTLGLVGVGTRQHVAFEGVVTTSSTGGQIIVGLGPSVSDPVAVTVSFSSVEAERLS